MPYFSVMVGGIGKIKRAGVFEENSSEYLDGFFTTCIFKAPNYRDAESLALSTIESRWRNGEYAKLVEGTINLQVEETHEISRIRFYSAKIVNVLRLGWLLDTIPEKGHSFY